MRKRKKNEFLKNDSIIPNEEDLDNLINAENEYDESARLKKLVLLFLIPLMLILGFLFKSKFNPEVKQEKLAEYNAQQQVNSAQERLIEYNQLVKEAGEALEKKEYDKTVFLYRQAISYQPTNLELYEKLILTLEESCKAENEIHCNAIQKVKEKLEKLK